MIYFALVDRLANGDPANDGVIDPKNPQAFHGGDLRGVENELPRLADMGVETLWLGPIASMRDEPFFGHGAFHGYWTRDLARLEPRFGSPADLDRLTTDARARGIGLVLDMVYNHLAPDHAWVSERPDWFHHYGPIAHWSDPTEVITHDVHGLPDLAQENPEVYAWLRDSSFGWLDRVHPIALRLDAVRHMDPAFLQRIGAELRAHSPGVQLWAEVFDGNVKTVLQTMETAKLDSAFDFPLLYAIRDVVCDDKPAVAIASVIDRTSCTSPDQWITFLDNHDTSRITTACHGDARRVDEALDLLFSLRGTPMITWGTEWGATGEGEPENRPDYTAHPDTPQARLFLQTRVSRIRALAARRKSAPALREGSSRTIGLGPDWFVIERDGESDRRWILYNGGPTTNEFRGIETLPHSVNVVDPEHRRAPNSRAGTVAIDVPDAPNLAPGDSLRIVGSDPALADWDPTAAPTVPGPVRFPGTAVQYKLAIVHADGTFSWSEVANQWVLGSPRRLSVRWGN